MVYFVSLIIGEFYVPDRIDSEPDTHIRPKLKTQDFNSFISGSWWQSSRNDPIHGDTCNARLIPLSQVDQYLGLAGGVRNGAGFDFFGRS